MQKKIMIVTLVLLGVISTTILFKMRKAMSQTKKQSIVFITGVSGAGKTTLLKQMCTHLSSESAACLYFDSIGVPSVDEMMRQYGGPAEWQKAMTERWVATIITEYKDKRLVFLEGQINLSFIELACQKYGVNKFAIILIHCSPEVRHKRLRINREQPELINAQMDEWAEYLEKQALEKNVSILDSGVMSNEEMIDWILKYVERTK